MHDGHDGHDGYDGPIIAYYRRCLDFQGRAAVAGCQLSGRELRSPCENINDLTCRQIVLCVSYCPDIAAINDTNDRV